MPETSSPTPSSVPQQPHQPHQPAHGRGLDEPELRAVAERVAQVADGLALLRQAAPESAAVLLGLRPPVVERARRALEDPGLAHRLAAHLASVAAAPAAERAPARPPAPRDPRELLEVALRRSDLQVLLTAAPEAAAVIFGVHPDLVEGAREVAASHPHLTRAAEAAWRA